MHIAYTERLKNENEFLRREYTNHKKIVIGLPDITFERELCVNFGGISARIFHAVAPHSEDTVLIDVPKENALFLGDVTSEDFYNNGYMDQDKLKALRRLIEETDRQYCV